MRKLLVTAATVALLLSAMGCHRTDPKEFEKHAKLTFTATTNTYYLELANTGTETLWPPYGADDLKFYIDGTQAPWPEPWSAHTIAKPIGPGGYHAKFWYRTYGEDAALLGAGLHELHFEFGPVKSNVLRVEVKEDGTVSYDGPRAGPSWLFPE